MNRKRDIAITEYSYLFIGEKDDGKNIAVDKTTFEEIEAFVLQNSGHVQYLRLGQNKKNKFLQAQNYVGIIQTTSGTTIEILPKITNTSKDNEEPDEIKKSKKLLIKMLKTLKNSPFQNIKTANLKVENVPLYEVFIGMFLEELSLLIKKGIKSDYIMKEENLRFLKGKLKIGEQIKKNSVHKERFYVEYDEFSAERIENRIIKTTLNFLYGRSKSNTNKKRIREFKFVFDEIKPIYNYKLGFSKIKVGRQMDDYQLVLRWCRVFLLRNSFSPYKGKEVAFALLFDMNMLFESYVGKYLKRLEGIGEVKLQDKKYSLAYCEGQERFRLKPDIVIERSDDTIICDTKWKVIDKEPNQGDMYQLYAYGTKYSNCNNLYLIYPYNGEADKLSYDYFKSKDKLGLDVIYFNLYKNKFHREEEISFLNS